jgi:hypothetical protein
VLRLLEVGKRLTRAPKERFWQRGRAHQLKTRNAAGYRVLSIDVPLRLLTVLILIVVL